MEDIDKIIDSIADEVLGKRADGGNAETLDQKNKTKQEPENALQELCQKEIKTEEDETEIYKTFLRDAESYIDSFVSSPLCKDVNAEKGMFKCTQETWSYCMRSFALDYFKKYKYLHNRRRERTEGGKRLDGDLLRIGLEVYETLCDEYRKVFQVYNVCEFLGIDKENMYRLSEMHTNFLKKAHSATENSLRIGIVSGRGNVTGHALLLNHDYEYTRTTQVIHTSNNGHISAADLPKLEDIQDIDVIEGTKQNQIETEM